MFHNWKFIRRKEEEVSIFCLIQGINNYAQINTYWRYTVRNMASNILLLACKKCFLTSQGLVGAGMNCRALKHMLISIYPDETHVNQFLPLMKHMLISIYP